MRQVVTFRGRDVATTGGYNSSRSDDAQALTTTLDDDIDLYRVGRTSHASVNGMRALEDEFGVEVPDTMLRNATFQTIASMRAMIVTLTGRAASA
jgi:acyl carrier protein